MGCVKYKWNDVSIIHAFTGYVIRKIQKFISATFTFFSFATPRFLSFEKSGNLDSTRVQLLFFRRDGIASKQMPIESLEFFVPDTIK